MHTLDRTSLPCALTTRPSVLLDHQRCLLTFGWMGCTLRRYPSSNRQEERKRLVIAGFILGDITFYPFQGAPSTILSLVIFGQGLFLVTLEGFLYCFWRCPEKGIC